MPELPHFSRDTDERLLWSAIDEFGGLIIDEFVGQALLAQIRKEVMPLVTEHKPGVSGGNDYWEAFHGVETKRITGLAEKSAGWIELLCDPKYQAMADHYLGVNNYYLNTAQLICIGPGETPQMLHRDELNWPRATRADQEITITAIFALTDFTEENGATVIAPGSQAWPGTLPEVKPEQTTRAVMKAGSALLYSGKVMHGGGPNNSKDEWRVGLHAGFVLGWLRAEENHQLSTSLEVARKLPVFAQRMLGFRSYVPSKNARLGLVNYEDAGLILNQGRVR